MLPIYIEQHLSLHTQYSFCFQGFSSLLFDKEEDCFISLLEYCLEHQILLVHVLGLNPALAKKVDAAFGKSFKLKFRFANTNLDQFIDFALSKSKEKSNFFLRLTFLLAPFHRVSFFNSDTVILKLPSQTNPEVEQFFNSNLSFQSDNYQHCYQPGDITFFSDASCDKFSILAGAALQNKHMVCAFRIFQDYEDNNLAEIKAVLQTIGLAQYMQCKNLILYTDNSNAIDFLSGKTKITDKTFYYFDVVEQIKSCLNDFDSFNISWISRKKNFIADNLSKHDFNGKFYHR